MNMLSLPASLIAALAASCLLVAPIVAKADGHVFKKPLPEYPQSEVGDAREGWVLVGFDVARSGIPSDVYILESSGNDVFDAETLLALQDWRFTPGDEHSETVLVNFVFDTTFVSLSRRFTSLNNRVHKSIDKGDLDKAEERLADLRDDDDFTVFELAYSYLTEGRIAGARGDKERQLELFRKAIRNEGRWLARENYHATLRAIIILEIELRDYGSAVHDYDVLADSPVGRDYGEDLKDVIKTIRAQLKELGVVMPVYMAANTEVSVERDRPKEDPTISQPPIDPRGGVAPSPPPQPSPPNRN